MGPTVDQVKYFFRPTRWRTNWVKILILCMASEAVIVYASVHLRPTLTGSLGVIAITQPMIVAVAIEPFIGVVAAICGAVVYIPYLPPTVDPHAEGLVFITWALSTTAVAFFAQAHRRRQQALLTRMLSVEKAERRRIAQDLHDDTIQILVATLFQFDRLERDQLSHPAVQGAQTLIRDALTRLRSLSFQLNPPVLSERGLQPALDELCAHMKKRFSEMNADLECRIAVNRRYSQNVEELAHRFVLECLSNTYKHARATVITVLVIDHKTAGLHIKVEDNGVGFNPEILEQTDGDKAILGLPARIQQIYWAGGHVKVESHRGRTCIKADLPPKPPVA